MNTNLLLSFLVIFRTFSADMLSLLHKYNNDVFDNIIFIKDFLTFLVSVRVAFLYGQNVS